MKPLPLVAEALVEVIAAEARLKAVVAVLSPENALRVKEALSGLDYARSQVTIVLDQALRVGGER